MSLSSYHFDLLPCPPRSVLSVGHETTRAQLPNFATVAELEEFVDRLFVYDLGQVPALFVQLKFSACFISFTLTLVILIIARRMYERSFWLVRIITKSSGRVIVPNTILCFSIVEAFFAASFIALQWLISFSFNEKTIRPFAIPLHLLLPWYPLLSGAVLATWGTYFAIPSELQRQTTKRASIVQRSLDHALVTNLLGLCVHLFVFVSIFTPAIIANVRWNKAHDKADRWRTMYAGQTNFTQPMVQEAQMVWYDLLDSMKLCSITFVIWAFFAVVVMFAYNCVCWTLMRVIREQLNGDRQNSNNVTIMVAVTTGQPQKSFLTGRQMTQRDLVEMQADEKSDASVHSATPIRPISLPLVCEEQDDKSQKGNSNVEDRMLSKSDSFCSLPTRGANGFHDPSSPRISVDQECGTMVERQALSPSPPPAPHVIASTTTKGGRRKQRRVWRRFVPKLIMSSQAYEHAVKSVQLCSGQNQRKELKRVYSYVKIQFAAIGPAGVCFAGLAIFMAIACFGMSEQPYNGGTMFELALGIVLVFLSWLTNIASGIVFFAIALRTYEPVLSNILVSHPSTPSYVAAKIAQVPSSEHS